MRVYCLKPGYRYYVPSASGDTLVCSCLAGTNEGYSKHLAVVEMFREASQHPEQARSLALVTGLERFLEQIEAEITELLTYPIFCTTQSERIGSAVPRESGNPWRLT